VTESTRERVLLGGALTLLLLGGAGLAAWGAVVLDDPGLDPHHSAVGTAGIFAAGFCLVALFKLERAMRGARSWMNASIWFIIASLSLFVLDLIALATRLGG